MTKLIEAAAAPARQHAESNSLVGYVIGSGLFIAAVFGLFTVAGFTG